MTKKLNPEHFLKEHGPVPFLKFEGTCCFGNQSLFILDPLMKLSYVFLFLLCVTCMWNPPRKQCKLQIYMYVHVERMMKC